MLLCREETKKAHATQVTRAKEESGKAQAALSKSPCCFSLPDSFLKSQHALASADCCSCHLTHHRCCLKMEKRQCMLQIVC